MRQILKKNLIKRIQDREHNWLGNSIFELPGITEALESIGKIGALEEIEAQIQDLEEQEEFKKLDDEGKIKAQEQLKDRKINEIINTLKEERLLPKIYRMLYKAIEKTYLGNIDRSLEGKYIGLNCTPEQQEHGITTMTLALYLINQVKNQYKSNPWQVEELYRKYADDDIDLDALYGEKSNMRSNIKAALYVLTQMSSKYKDYFSYGYRTDHRGRDTFAIDIPGTGQFCFHYGAEKYDRKQKMKISPRKVEEENARKYARAILEQKRKSYDSYFEKEIIKTENSSKKEELSRMKLKYQRGFDVILERLNGENSIVPSYEGKLYEYESAIPINFVGEKMKRCAREILRGKLQREEITSEQFDKIKKEWDKCGIMPKLIGITSNDIVTMANYGLNQREMYSLFIKMYASKKILKDIAINEDMIYKISIGEITDEELIEAINYQNTNEKNEQQQPNDSRQAIGENVRNFVSSVATKKDLNQGRQIIVNTATIDREEEQK